MTDVKQVGNKRPNNVRFVFWQEIMNNDVQVGNTILPDKKGIEKVFFLFLHENICCGYALEASH